MMQIYHYSQFTGEYIGEGLADNNPKDPANPLIPAFATSTAPAGVPAPGYAAVFVDGEWKIVEDNRGTAYSTENGGMVGYELLGPLPESLTKFPRPSDDYVWADGAWVIYQPKVDARLAELARMQAKLQAIADNLPSWGRVSTTIKGAFPTVAQQNVMLKMARVLYWLAKGTET